MIIAGHSIFLLAVWRRLLRDQRRSRLVREEALLSVGLGEASDVLFGPVGRPLVEGVARGVAHLLHLLVRG